MHPLQERLLELTTSRELGKMSLREIGELLDSAHPQTIKHHLQQLEQKGLVEVDRSQGIVRRVRAEERTSDRLITVPILGSADCGPATVSDYEKIEGYLKISCILLERKLGLFALKAIGNSMNMANIDGMNIEDGDYVIVDSSRRHPNNKEYVVSVTDGLANIKRFLKVEASVEVVLISESTQDYPPIVIHPEDVEFLICGTIIKVVKRPNLS